MYFLLDLFSVVVVEIIGTFFMIFAGCGLVVIDNKTNGSITHLGVLLVWGMAVMILVYAIGHISGAHLNPAVILDFAIVWRFHGLKYVCNISSLIKLATTTLIEWLIYVEVYIKVFCIYKVLDIHLGVYQPLY